MLSLGLSVADQRLFEQSLITGYQLRVTIQILDLNHRYVSDVSEMLLDGQVNRSLLENVTSSMSCTLLDPDGAIGFDTTSPSDGALYADRMIRVVYSVYSELLPRWVDVPIFCGPVTKVSRDDAILSVECQGKETFYMEPTMAWRARNYTKGTKLVAAVRDILASKGGETKFELPGWTNVLPRDYALTTETPLWNMVKWIVGSQSSRQVYYDGRGVLKLRVPPTTASFTFTENHLLSVPKLTYNMETIRNCALVKGGTPAGKRQIIAIRHLPASNPSSSVSLARNGVTRPLVEVVEDTTIMTQAAANQRAADVLAGVAVSNIDFDFDSLPIPHIEPGDQFNLTTRDVSIQLRVTNFSIPLKAGNAQSNGTLRRISANRTRIRRK